MNLTRDRLRSIGWATLLTVCTALTAGLSLRVDAVKSEVHQAERRIVAMRGEITFLETEYQTRSNQQQLKALNDVEFGYTAPRAQQYIEGERQLAALGSPRGPGAPAPIRVASAAGNDRPAPFLPMVSPVIGAAKASEVAGPARKSDMPASRSAARAPSENSGDDPIGAAIDAHSLSQRLVRIGSGVAQPE